MAEHKLQHYVPQAYLRRFAADEKDEHVYVYDKLDSRSFRTSTHNVASQSYFHDLPQLTDEQFDEMLGKLREQGFAEQQIREVEPQLRDPKLVEKMLSQYETLMNDVIGKVIEDAQSRHSLASGARGILADIMARQFIRTASHRMSIEQELNRFTNEVLVGRIAKSHYPEEDFSNIKVVATDEYIKARHLAFLFSPEPVSSIVKILTESHIWIIGRNTTLRPLYTSDNPVVRRGHLKDALGNKKIGFAAQGLEVNFPLSSEYVLITREREHFADQYEHLDGRVIELSGNEVLNCNRLQIAWSHRQIVCSRKDFAEVKKMCRKYPSLRNANRETFGTEFAPLYEPDGTVSEVYHMYDIAPNIEFLGVSRKK